MKYVIYIMVVLCCPLTSLCQDITGLWKGTLINDETKQSLPYEILISKEKGKYTGYSHTWFIINDQKYYGVKKINIRIAKDGKVVIQDADLVDNNYPTPPYKKVRQLNVLDLSGDALLDGQFFTNSTTELKEVTGHISIQKTSLFAQSDLMEYLHKNNKDTNLTVAK